MHRHKQAEKEKKNQDRFDCLRISVSKDKHSYLVNWIHPWRNLFWYNCQTTHTTSRMLIDKGMAAVNQALFLNHFLGA